MEAEREAPSPSTTVAEVFRPPGGDWVRVSPVLARAYRIELAITFGIGVLLVCGGLLLIPDVPRAVPAINAAEALDAFVWIWIVIGRRVGSWGYAERADDLLVTSGILFRRLVIVPYGRMQLVDVTAGPLHRLLGITTVQLHTAAATTDASIPGLTPDVAADLRDRLARRGEERSAGL
ncbi:MAG: PH domain-containing protein [Candidatus Nanopelagicales bacterium]